MTPLKDTSHTKNFLDTPLKQLSRFDTLHTKALARLRLLTVRDILYHVPVRYTNTENTGVVQNAEVGEALVLYGTLSNLKTRKTWKTKVAISEGRLSDGSGTIDMMFFNQPYIAKMFHEGDFVKVTGVITLHNDKRSMNNPKLEKVTHAPIGVGDSLFKNTQQDTGTIFPIYRETKGVTSLWIYHMIKKILANPDFKSIADSIPDIILKTYKLPTFHTACVWLHTPRRETDAQVARKRFAFEEIFYIQLKLQQERRLLKDTEGYTIPSLTKDTVAFVKKLPFKLTGDQQKSINTIIEDMESGIPMSRLLQGDVGSGKTAVAAATTFGVCHTHPKGQNFGYLQTAYMAPTEILAKQHFESFITFFKGSGLPVALITGKECYKFPSKSDPNRPTRISKVQLKKWVANGEVALIVGTHALIQKTVEFKHLAYVIIDEQHRFGTRQRKMLMEKEGLTPHLLSMTATPIPRTLALTVYGDLDVSVIAEMPSGRQHIETKIIKLDDRKKVYEHIRKEISLDRQAYIICPRIQEPDPSKEQQLQLASVEAETKRLKEEVFPDAEIAMLHGKMTPAQKDEVMTQFAEGYIDILVATSVVEVGVNAPNASIILIEGAERFGLSQIHQLRGRVIRGNHKPYCYLFPNTKSEKTWERLHALEKTHNGFELAEYDLKLRGSGDLVGNKQWGLSDLAMDALANIQLVEAAQKTAKDIVADDPLLKKHNQLRNSLAKWDAVHME